MRTNARSSSARGPSRIGSSNSMGYLPWPSSLPPLALREPGSDEMPADRRRVRLFVHQAAADEQPGDVLVPGAGAAPFRGRLESAAAERVCPPPHHRTSVGVWSAQQ